MRAVAVGTYADRACAREHVERARALRYIAAETTQFHDIDEQLDSIDEALRTVARCEDRPRARLTELRRELYEMVAETLLEGGLRGQLRLAPGHIRAYQTERFGAVDPIQ